jgi:hypothetical protein
MPRRGHSSGRRRTGSGQSDSESSSDSDSEARRRLPSGQGRQDIRRAPRIVRAPPRVVVDPRVICPGCSVICASLDSLKRHRNSSRLANAACRAAASANKRPRPVPRAGGGGDGPDASAARDLIDRMVGDGNQGVAPGDVPDPSRYPRHVDGVRGLHICTQSALSSCLYHVCILYAQCLFALSLQRVCT